MTLLKKPLLFIYLVLTVLTFQAATPHEALGRFLSTNGIQGNSVAVKIIDLKNGSIIIDHNSNSPLVPASIMKSVTTAALLGNAGPDWKYHTRIYIDGPNDLGYIRGNLIIEGACDPTVNSEKQPFSPDLIEEICNSLTSRLITRIEGNIIIDQTAFEGESRPASWTPADRKKYYGTGSHGFNYNDNVSGDFSVDNPSLKFLGALKKELASRGIELEGKDMIEGKRIQIHDHLSASLDEIMRSCMMRSDNMFAEAMLRTYGKLEGGDGSTVDSAEREMLLWKKKKLPLEGVVIVDGSGLSRDNRVTADFMGALLSKMSIDPYYASFFPLAGKEGTLRKFLTDTPLDSYIAMKTGSMTGIQCYAGYKLDDDYVPTHVVVIIMNDIPAKRENVVKAAEQLLLEVFE